MKSHTLLALSLLIVAFAAHAADTPAAAAAPTTDPAASETPAQRDARMAWWREARFGMFVHWGLYSGLADT